jgi:hypothetical protein
MQNESNIKENTNTNTDTIATYLVGALAALVLAAVLFSAGFYLASAIIAAMITE